MHANVTDQVAKVQVSQSFVKMGEDRSGARKAHSGRKGSDREAPGQLTQRKDFCGLGRTDTAHLTQLCRSR